MQRVVHADSKYSLHSPPSGSGDKTLTTCFQVITMNCNVIITFMWWRTNSWQSKARQLQQSVQSIALLNLSVLGFSFVVHLLCSMTKLRERSGEICYKVWQFYFCTGGKRQIEQPTCPQSYHHNHDHHLHWATYPQKHSRRPRVGSSASLFHSLRPATL